jgi:hypothetical protein
LRVIDHFKSNVIEYLEHNLAATPVSLSKQFRPTLSGESTPDDEFESIERYERIIRCCIKCIVTHFPDFPSTPIIALLSPTTSPIIQSEVIQYLLRSEPLLHKIPDQEIFFLVSEVALVVSAPIFFQESVWALINVLPTNVFDKKPLFSKLVNFLKLSDSRSWNSVMMNTLPRLVNKNSEIVEIVAQRIEESMVLRNSKLFHTLCCFILRLDPTTVDRLVGLARPENPMKYALVTAMKKANISLNLDTQDPVIELLLYSSHQSRNSQESIVELVHSLPSISDLKFVTDKCQGDEVIMSSISSHPKLVSLEWIDEKSGYISLIDSLLTSGWKFLGDFYNSSISLALPFECVVELVTTSSGDWVPHARAPEIKDPDQLAAKILETEEFTELFKRAIEFNNRQQDNTRDNGIICIGRSDFNRVIEQIILFGNMTDFLLETNSISPSIARAVLQRVCCDQDLRITSQLCAVVKQVVQNMLDLDAVISAWCTSAFVLGDDRFENLSVEDITEFEEIGRNKIIHFLVSHRFVIQKFPKIDIFKNNCELLAIWIVRKNDSIDSHDMWDQFNEDLDKVENWSRVMDEFVGIMGGFKSVSWRVILESFALIAKRTPIMSREWVKSMMRNDAVPFAVRLCMLIQKDLDCDDVDFGSLEREDEFAQMIVDILCGDFVEENCVRFLSLGTEAGLRRSAERSLAKSFPKNSEFLDLFYHLDDEKVAEYFVCSGDVKACEDAASRYLSIVGTPWRIDPGIADFLGQQSSLEWAIGTLSTPLNRLGQARIMNDSVEIFDLVSIAQFRSTLRLLLDSNNGCVVKLMDSLVKKFVRNSDEEFISLFELSESLGGDETGELRKIFMDLLRNLAVEILEEGVKTRRSGSTPPLAEMTDSRAMFVQWAQCVSPGEFHDWVSRGAAPANFSDTLVKSGLSSKLIEQALEKKYTNPSLKQSYSKSSKLLVCRYTTCGGEITAELTVSFPETWPARLATIEVSAVAGLSRAKNARLKISIQQVFRTNGVQQAVQIWIENIEGFLANVEECYICYSVTYHHGTKGTGSGTGTGGAIPDKECRNCHYKFHAQCLLKWFKQSQKTNCVLCQQPF